MWLCSEQLAQKVALILKPESKKSQHKNSKHKGQRQEGRSEGEGMVREQEGRNEEEGGVGEQERLRDKDEELDFKGRGKHYSFQRSEFFSTCCVGSGL